MYLPRCASGRNIFNEAASRESWRESDFTERRASGAGATITTPQKGGAKHSDP